MRETISVKKRPLRRWLIAAVLVVLLLTVAGGVGKAILEDSDLRWAVKHQLIQLDSRYLGGLLRRLYRGESLPELPDDLPSPRPGAYMWLPSQDFFPIAHRAGPDMMTGPNSERTILRALNNGFRIIEVDLTLTRDDRLVCYHGEEGENLNALGFEDYAAKRAAEGTSPCEFSDLLRLARANPGTIFVLDVKNRFDKAYDFMRGAIESPEIGRVFIPQLYFFEQLERFRRDPFFGGVILTSYKTALTTEQIIHYARATGVTVVTLTLPRLMEIIDDLPPDLVVLTHPVNDPGEAFRLRGAGVRGIYTSDLGPDTASELFGD